MPAPTVSNLINLRDEKVKHISILDDRRRSLMSRIDSLNDQIEAIEAQVFTLGEEINSAISSAHPTITLKCFGLDERRNKIYGALITFSDLDIEIYKILNEFDYFLEDINLKPVEFHARLKNAVLEWLAHADLSEYVDLTEKQKNVISVCIKQIQKDNANMSRFRLNQAN